MNFSPLLPGKSVNLRPINAYITDTDAKGYLYLIGGTHGDEIEGIHLLQNILNWLKESGEILSLPIVTVPILNVDGHAAGTRQNARGVDLNRNYPTDDWTNQFEKERYFPGEAPLSEPENVFLSNLFTKFHPSIIISFHTWKPMINYNGDCREIAQLLNHFNNYEIKSDIGYPTPGSLGTYAPQKFNAPVITFECPSLEDNYTLESIWSENERPFKELFRSNLFDHLRS